MSKKRKLFKAALSITSALGVNVILHGLVPPYINTLGRVSAEVAIFVISWTTYEAMETKAEAVIRDFEAIANGNASFKVV